jgi:hypothetical protein
VSERGYQAQWSVYVAWGLVYGAQDTRGQGEVCGWATCMVGALASYSWRL